MGRILLVEDEPRLVQHVVAGLSAAGIACDHAASLRQALACADQTPYAAAVIDRGLPDGDGLDLVRRLRRAARAMPCMILTARDALHDRVEGLEAGADDHLSKPFEMAELVARTRALMRRAAAWTAEQVEFNGLSVDLLASSLRCGPARVVLSPAELQVMLALMQARGGTVRRATLETAAWGASEAVSPNALDVVVHRLRRKLAALGAPGGVVNVKGRLWTGGPWLTRAA